MKKYFTMLAGLVAVGLYAFGGSGVTDAGFPMVDPKLDDPAKP